MVSAADMLAGALMEVAKMMRLPIPSNTTANTLAGGGRSKGSSTLHHRCLFFRISRPLGLESAF